MHKLSPVHIAASVVIAVAGTVAFAEGAKPVAAGSAKGATTASASSTSTLMTGTGNRIDVIPRTQAGLPTNTLTSLDASPMAGITLTNTSKSDARNDQTLKATAGTRSSGPTSTSPAAGGTSATSASSGTQTAGSSAGATGTTAGTSGGLNTGAGTDVTAATTLATTPVLINSIVGSSYGSDVVLDDREVLAGAQYVQANGVTLQPVVTDTARAGASMDRVVRQAQRDRSKIGRNGQLLYSIAPRTSVDRSNEMPDDGPTAALKGPLSR